MKSQYTPTYHHFWNRDFTLLTIAEMLLCISCYMTIPLLPFRLVKVQTTWNGLSYYAIISLIIGICISGFFSSWLIQRYRRNKVYSISAICLGATIFGLSLLETGQHVPLDIYPYALLTTCFVSGFVFGTAKRVLSCTLLIDKTDSCHRTEANYTAIWISRLTIIAGPLLALMLHNELKGSLLYMAGAATTLASALLVMCVKFPFRAPEEGVHLLSIDRFFLPQGWTVSLVITLTTIPLGLMIASRMIAMFYAALMTGFVVAALALQIQTIRNTRFASAAGYAISILAILTMSVHDDAWDCSLKPMIFGLGIALILSKQLYKLLNNCDHCQRSTAESTYFLSSDCGLFLGIALGWQLTTDTKSAEQVALYLLIASAIICTLNIFKKKKQTRHHA